MLRPGDEVPFASSRPGTVSFVILQEYWAVRATAIFPIHRGVHRVGWGFWETFEDVKFGSSCTEFLFTGVGVQSLFLRYRWETKWVRLCFPRRISWVLLVGTQLEDPYQVNQRRRRSLETKHVDDAPQNVDLVRRNESETEARGDRKRKQGKKGV